MTRADFPAGPLGGRAWEIAQSNGGYGLQALADAASEMDQGRYAWGRVRVGFLHPLPALFNKMRAVLTNSGGHRP